jgi:alpha,alpha-trehalase
MMSERSQRSSHTLLSLFFRGYPYLFIIVALAGCAAQPQQFAAMPRTPAEIYGELFRDVQTQAVFTDSKTFVDTLPKRSPEAIVAAYRKEKQEPAFDLRAFVAREFTVTTPPDTAYRTLPGEDVRTHIDRLWKVLTREPTPEPPYSSRLQLPKRYVVPGGRFNEIYYWDSYFTMVGLKTSGETQLIRDMCDNFAHLIERYGHIPNGNRTYYLSRSQPPFFAAMVELLATIDGEQIFARYRDALRKEYEFWMEGSQAVERGSAHRRVVRLADGTVLNRYWDDRATPRDEAYREDIATAQRSGRPADEVYRNLRATAESGFDFSSRWFADRRSLATVQTVDLVPVDLNSLLYQLELTLAKAYAQSPSEADKYRAAAQTRQQAVQRLLWNEPLQTFSDYDWRKSQLTDRLSAATFAPLFFGLATQMEADAVARTARERLLKSHGIVTTPITTTEQWDAPNGWAPLQWLAIEGLNRYGETQLAEQIAQRWVEQNIAVFKATGKLVEKYDVTSQDVAAGGGEYPLQDGFGWTNGVLRALLEKYPHLAQ